MTTPADRSDPRWTEIFDGRSLDGWEAGVFGEPDEIDWTSDGVVLPIGVPMAGITYLRDAPSGAFSLEVEATKQYGSDFFLGVTFPVRGAHLSLILGGWGGVVCGLSNLDGEDASENPSHTTRSFPNGKRYRVVVDVDDTRVTVFVDGERLIDQSLVGRALSIRPEVQPSLPLGLASFATVTTVHRVRVLQRGAP